MDRTEIGDPRDIPVGSHKIVEINGREIGIFHEDGRFFAVRNLCPHQGAPLCKGSVSGTTAPSQPGQYLWNEQNKIISCPWHNWEFDLATGRCLVDASVWVRTYPVIVEDGRLLVEI